MTINFNILYPLMICWIVSDSLISLIRSLYRLRERRKEEEGGVFIWNPCEVCTHDSKVILRAIAHNSAHVLDRSTTFCFLLHQIIRWLCTKKKKIGWLPRKVQCPLVDCLTWNATQSASENPWNRNKASVKSPWYQIHWPPVSSIRWVDQLLLLKPQRIWQGD